MKLCPGLSPIFFRIRPGFFPENFKKSQIFSTKRQFFSFLQCFTPIFCDSFFQIPVQKGALVIKMTSGYEEEDEENGSPKILKRKQRPAFSNTKQRIMGCFQLGIYTIWGGMRIPSSPPRTLQNFNSISIPRRLTFSADVGGKW